MAVRIAASSSGTSARVRPARAVNDKFPNFFILGAPKCGTTSLAAWLADNPSVFIPKIKEPHFFNTDDKQGVRSFAEYLELFATVSERHLAIGEASVWYLSSAVAVRNIVERQPGARFVVAIRNPIEMAPSLHSEMVVSGHESVRDFRSAWDLQDLRRAGKRRPAQSWAARRLLYGDVCALGSQLKRLKTLVSARQIHVVVLDDLIENPRREYLKLLDFLGATDDGRVDFPIYNSRKSLKWPQATRALFVAAQIKNKLGVDLKLDLWRRLSDRNVTNAQAASLPQETFELLSRYFADEIALLERELGRNLQYWHLRKG